MIVELSDQDMCEQSRSWVAAVDGQGRNLARHCRIAVLVEHTLFNMPARAPSTVQPYQLPSGMKFRHRPDKCKVMNKSVIPLEGHLTMVCALAFRMFRPAPAKETSRKHLSFRR
jgi:hypothetical protein